MLTSIAARALHHATHAHGKAWRGHLPTIQRIRGASRCIAGSAADVVIIGGGVIGGSCALELRKQGFKTLNVDTNPAPSYGSTSSSSAIIRHFYSLEDSCRLAWDAYHYWAAWRDHLEAGPGEDLCALNEIGCAALDVPASPAAVTYLSRVREAMKACNVPCEEWDAAELQKRMPYISTTSYFPPRRIDDDEFGQENGTSIAGLLFCPKAGYVNDPQLAGRNVVEAAMRLGSEFKWRSRVVKINRNESGTKVTGVTLDDGSIVEAPIVINVAGPHSQAVHDMAFQEAGGACDDSNIRSKPLQVEVAYVPEPPGSRMDETCPVVADLDAGVYFRPQQGGQLLIGSVEPECDELHFLGHADELEEGLTDEWNNLVYRAALRFPSLQIPNNATGLVALYDTTPDFVPIYDKTSLGGFYSIRGTSGNQFKNAPVVGKICAKLVDGVENGHDHDATPLSLPLEFASGSINLGIFSRLRKGEGTTGTVLG